MPMVDVQEVKVDMPTLSVAHTGGFTTVTTDLLTVEISHKGGTIQAMPRNNF
jgi:hypothetical protein